ncbi:GPALPP motifs-containing protein 1-like isoform X2 [Zootermopsis nevadensis]|nr:GPALPP motifs-containing protein 1-like isoform X2 [Zootermopsis nevadensis]
MSNLIGPALPPHLQMKVESSENQETSKSNESQMEQDRKGDVLIDCPSLPPELIQRMKNPSVFLPEITEKRNSQAPEIGPSLPPHLCIAHNDIKSPPENEGSSIGPALPPQLKMGQKTENHNESQSSVVPLSKETDEDDVISLPNLGADVSHEEAYGDGPQDEMYGPALPPGLKVRPSSFIQDVKTSRGVLGPCLPPAVHLSYPVDDGSSDSDADVVGPIFAPEGIGNATYLQDQIDDRALRMKRKLAGKDGNHDCGPVKRESWMLELPPDRAASFGLGPRQFRARAKPESGDRSVWTDTPADRLQKKHTPREKSGPVDKLELAAVEERDKEMQHLVEKHSGKKRQESLLEAHQKELKKIKKGGKHEERRPFDRSVDLQANRFDEAQKKAIFKKAALLNDRFSSGQRKFL